MQFGKILLGTFILLASACSAQDSWEKIEITTVKVAEDVNMLAGRGGNIGVIEGDSDILVIDAQFEPLYDKINASIKAISSKPITYLFNTHWHGDHTGGNNKFNEDGALLIAHQNVQERLSNPQEMEFFGREVPAAAKEKQPEITFDQKMTLDLGNQTVEMRHFPNAHTDGDAMLIIKDRNVIHMGDIYFEGAFPFIDISSNGNINGYIEACNYVISISDNSTKIIPGHGNISNKNELEAYKNMLEDLLSKVSEAKKAGIGLKEILSVEFTKPYEENYGNGFIKSKDIITFIYQSLS